MNAKASSVPNWLPDWTDITAYPNKAEKNPRVWAWEFLRRNQEYQKMWEQIQSLPEGSIYHDFSLDDINERLESDFGLRIPAPPSMKSSDPDFSKRPRFVTHGRIWIRPVDWPEDADPYTVNELLCDPTEAFVRVDLRWQLEDQLRAIKDVLKSKKRQLQSDGILERGRRLRSTSYVEHLRLLDAEAAAQNQKKMAEIIYKNVDDHAALQQVWANLQRAKWLRDKGFRYIAMSNQA